MPYRIIGFDIGSYSVKAAVIERGFKSFAFTEFYERRVIRNELISIEESEAIAIQGLIDDLNLSWDIACVDFPAQKVTTRLLTFPFGSAKKIDQTVQFEIENYIPFSMEDVVVDYLVVWHTKDASRVMVAYVQKKDLAKLLTVLDGVELDPKLVCVDGIELIGIVNLGTVPPEGAYAIIDLGHEKSTISICHGRQLSFVRAVSVAGKAITQAIADRMGVPYDEAEKMKIEMGGFAMSSGESEIDEITQGVSDAIRSVMDEFLLHLKQTFFTYRETENIPIEGVYLCGGTSRLPGIDRYLSDALKLNVAYLNCSEFHFTKLEHADAHRHVIPQALALALRGAAGGGPDINLRQGEFAFKGDVEELGGSVRKVGVILGLIVFLAILSFATKYYSIKRQIDGLHDDIATVVKQALPGTPARAVANPKSALSFIKSKDNEVSDKMSQIHGVMGTSPLSVLKEISELLPPKEEFRTEVSEINIAPDRVTLSGIVDDFKAVDTFKQSMEKSKLFTNITTGDVGKGVKGEVKFKLSMDMAGRSKE